MKRMALGRPMVAIRVILVVAALLLTCGGRLRIGWLPGYFVIRGRHFVFCFPLATCVVLNLVLSILMWALERK